MGNEKFSILPIPEFVGSFPECYVNLLVFNGSLGAIVYPTERIDTSFDLWVTSEGVWTNNSILNPFLELYTHWDLEKMLKELEINTYLDHFRFAISLHAYLESLVRINGIQEVEKYVIR
ncbi:hypothetical protein Gotur_019251 [Gossypium turneri]